MAIKQKYFGNLQLDNLGKAVRTVPAKVEKTAEYGHQLKIKAAMWEDGRITIDIWDAENQVSHKLGKLFMDTEYATPKNKPKETPETAKEEDDLPF